MFIHEKKNHCLGIVLVLLLWAWPAQAATVGQSVNKGNHFYKTGEFTESLRMYEEGLKKDPESDILNFNAGTALYKEGRYDDAVAHLQKAILSDEKSLQQRAHYNLGNALYKSGAAKEKKDIATAVKSLEESLQHYLSALALDKADTDAQYNYDFVKKELERLIKEQQKQQQQSDRESPDKKDKQNQQSQQQSGQNQNAQQGQGQQQQQSQDQNQQQGQQEQESSEAQEQQSDSQKNSLEKQEQDGQKESHDESSQEEQSKENSSAGASEGTDSPGENKTDAPTSAVQGRELTEDEARRLLQHYQQTEEPKGLFPVFKQRQGTGPVIKDW